MKKLIFATALVTLIGCESSNDNTPEQPEVPPRIDTMPPVDSDDKEPTLPSVPTIPPRGDGTPDDGEDKESSPDSPIEEGTPPRGDGTPDDGEDKESSPDSPIEEGTPPRGDGGESEGNPQLPTKPDLEVLPAWALQVESLYGIPAEQLIAYEHCGAQLESIEDSRLWCSWDGQEFQMGTPMYRTVREDLGVTGAYNQWNMFVISKKTLSGVEPAERFIFTNLLVNEDNYGGFSTGHEFKHDYAGAAMSRAYSNSNSNFSQGYFAQSLTIDRDHRWNTYKASVANADREAGNSQKFSTIYNVTFIVDGVAHKVSNNNTSAQTMDTHRMIALGRYAFGY